MILQYYFERPENVDTLKVSMVQIIFTITWFHKNSNINCQFSRFIIPGLEDVFAEIEQQIKRINDLKVSISHFANKITE